jgi:acyl carrier protein
MMASSESAIVDVLSVTLRVPPGEITEDFSPNQCPNWDSVQHILIILAIEDRLGITFDEKEIPRLTSFSSIRDAVNKLVQKQ